MSARLRFGVSVCLVAHLPLWRPSSRMFQLATIRLRSSCLAGTAPSSASESRASPKATSAGICPKAWTVVIGTSQHYAEPVIGASERPDVADDELEPWAPEALGSGFLIEYARLEHTDLTAAKAAGGR